MSFVIYIYPLVNYLFLPLVLFHTEMLMFVTLNFKSFLFIKKN